MCEQRRAQIDPVARERSGGHIRQVAVGFQFREDPFLRTSAVMESEEIVDTDALVGDDRLEIIAPHKGGKEVQLHRLLGLDLISLAHKHEAGASLPFIGFPLTLKIDDSCVMAPLVPASLSETLELGEELKGHADAVFYPLDLQHLDNLVLKNVLSMRVSMIALGATARIWWMTSQNERLRAVGIMHIARAMPQHRGSARSAPGCRTGDSSCAGPSSCG